MILRPFLVDKTACASYLFGCTTHARLAVVDPHVELVERYLEAAGDVGAAIVAVFETHVQADHVSGLPELVQRTGATAYLPAGVGVEFPHVQLADGVLVCPSHYGGSVCGRALSGNPFSTIGFERLYNGALQHAEPESFASALLVDLPPPPAGQAAIVAANRAGAVASRP